MSYQNEAEKETPDHEKLDQWENEFQNIYGEIMLNPNMRVFEEKKQAVDDLMNYIVNLLSVIVNGGDPDTAEPAPAKDGVVVPDAVEMPVTRQMRRHGKN